jgi:hypothetical protein
MAADGDGHEGAPPFGGAPLVTNHLLLKRYSPLRLLELATVGESDGAPGPDTHAPDAWEEGGRGPFTASSGAGGSAWESNPPRNGKPPRQRF